MIIANWQRVSAQERMLSMGTGMGMGTGAEELGSNPLHVPVACAAFKLTTSGQPLRVCVSGHSVH